MWMDQAEAKEGLERGLEQEGSKGKGVGGGQQEEKRGGEGFFYKSRPNSGRKGALRTPLHHLDPWTSRGLDARALSGHLCVR